MEKVKFKNPKKYKGIVEKVFVKEGQPVKQGQQLAFISTQFEKFKIEAPIEGVIRNIYIIESLIVSHGDTIFDIFTNKELNNLLKKPKSINDTLKEGLSEFGYLDKVLNDCEYDDQSQQIDTYSIVDNKENEENQFKNMDQINQINDLNEISDLEESKNFEYKKFETFDVEKTDKAKKELNIEPKNIDDNSISDLAIPNELIFENEKDIEIFSNYDNKIADTQVVDKVRKQIFLSKFSNKSDQINLQNNNNNNNNNNDLNYNKDIIEKNKEIIDEVIAEINKEKEELQQKIDNDNKKFVNKGPKFDYLDEKKLEQILKNSEELEHKFDEIEQQKDKLEYKLRDIDIKINNYNNKLNESIENRQNNIEEKDLENKIENYVSQLEEKNNNTINNLFNSLENQISNIEEKIKIFNEINLGSEKEFSHYTNTDNIESISDIKIKLNSLEDKIKNINDKNNILNENILNSNIYENNEVIVLLKEKINSLEQEIKNIIDNKPTIINNEQTKEILELKEKINSLEQEIKNNFICKNDLNNSEIINNLQNEIKNIDSKLFSQNSILEEKIITEVNKKNLDKNNNDSLKDSNLSSFLISVDITALINLHSIMLDVFEEENLSLNMDVFYLKALKKTLLKFNKWDSKNNLIRFVKKSILNSKDNILNINETMNFMDIYKELEKNNKYQNQNIEVVLFDLSNIGLENINLNLAVNSNLSIYIGKITNNFKDDGNLSNFININFVFENNKLNEDDVIYFAKEFTGLLSNPGFLI